jgi:hypothetical protein
MITLAAAQDSRLLRISGVCSQSQQFIDLLNNATRLLLKRGNWEATIQFADTCIYGNTVTWNRYVGTVLALHVNCGSTIPMNLWFDWVDPGDAEARDRFHFWHKHGCGTVYTVAIGNSPVFNQIHPPQAEYIQVFITNPADIGKTITFFGIDDQRQPVITRRPDGTFQTGEQMTLGIPYTMSTKLYLHVDRVVKDPTVGRLNVFRFDPTQSLTLPLAVYEPNETAPMYQQSRVPNYRAGCGCPLLVSAMVKVAYVEVQQPTDWVQINNLDALALAMQSVKHSDAYDHVGAEAAMARAVRDLNYQLRDRFPLEQTTVSLRPFGTATLNKLNLGMR